MGIGVVWLMTDWRYKFSNSLQESRINATLWDGHPEWPGQITFGEAQILTQRKFVCDFSADKHLFWVEEGKSRRYSAEELADHLATCLMDEIQKRSIKPR
jgi:hypothetical protein